MKPEAPMPSTLSTTHQRFHPLELIPFFRRFEPGVLRTLLYTLFFNCIIALVFILFSLVFTRISDWQDVGRIIFNNLLIANAIGFTWALTNVLLHPLLVRINRLPFWGVIACYTVLGFVVTQGVLFVLGFVPGFEGIRRWSLTPQSTISTLAIAFLISLVIGLSWRARIGSLEAEARLAHEAARVQEMERQTAEANLRALQAQIEPHFLFNTLANVSGLIGTQPDRARQMLEQFIAYLRATLSSTRQTSTTLQHEMLMTQNFLAILQVRMGNRLQVEIDLPPDLHDVSVPPMLLQPLVENAIKHGLEPKIDGGLISVSARQQGDFVEIRITDTGVGFQGAQSNGVGLKNVRDRIRHVYGERGQLRIEDNVPHGTRIILVLPINHE